MEERLLRDEVDILLISPERFGDERFRNEVLAKIAERIAFLVIDEAHCISDWGHDFRPHYRLIERIARTLPPNLRLLATTATANNRVMDDLRAVLGPDLEVSRGDLDRPSLLLQTIRLPRQSERLAWLAEQVPALPGHGIIYTLTVRDANQVAEWLQSRGIEADAYTGQTGDRREELEQALLDNRLKALVATTALGMGFDKPDLGFVIHYQSPASVVHYYQQVGRAGRALDAAYGVLLSGEEETEIADYFIRSAFPTPDEVRQVIDALEEAPDGLSLPALLGEVNVSKGRIEKTIQHRGALADRLEIRALDGEPGVVRPPDLPPLPAEAAPDLLPGRGGFPRLPWPAGGMPQYGVRGNISMEHRAEAGKALCIWSDAGWGGLVRVGKYRDGRFADDLVDACVDLTRRWDSRPAPEWVTCIPSRRHTNLVPDFADRLAKQLGLPFYRVLEKTEDRAEQKTMANGTQQARNVDGSLVVSAEQLLHGPVLLVDDMVDSRWTLTVAAWLLRSHGSGEVWPLALALTSHGR